MAANVSAICHWHRLRLEASICGRNRIELEKLLSDLGRERIDRLLIARAYDDLARLSVEDRLVWRAVRSGLYHTNDILRWHSIEAAAVLLRAQWDSGRQEKVRDYLRELVWSISDESGGFGWSAPQTIAETVMAIPQLSDPFVNVMIDRAFSEPALLDSGLWAVGRLGRRAGPSVSLCQEAVLASFAVDEPQTLGLAAWALGEVGFVPSLHHLQKLKPRLEAVRIYVPPLFREQPLGDWAEAAIAAVGRGASRV